MKKNKKNGCTHHKITERGIKSDIEQASQIKAMLRGIHHNYDKVIKIAKKLDKE